MSVDDNTAADVEASYSTFECPSTRDNGYYLKDGYRLIDFVLVRSSVDEDSGQPNAKYTVFEHNLEKEGLILEKDYVSSLPDLVFVKIHTPWDVLRRYAEILKIRMPIKEPADASSHDILSKLPIIHHLSILVDNNFLQPNRCYFPKKTRFLTAIYSRDREYLFEMDNDFFSRATRSRIVAFILERKWFTIRDHEQTLRLETMPAGTDRASMNFGITKLLLDNTYQAAYALHDGEISQNIISQNQRSLLYHGWARLVNCVRNQPLDHIQDYFGVKIALYFAWLGFYTYSLVPVTIVGILCFLYGIFTLESNALSNEICEDRSEVPMCPMCDTFCPFWHLNETCTHSRITYLVDNPSTVFYAVFMSLWATMFLEFWKRYSAEITYRWDLTTFDTNEEHPRPQFLSQMKNARLQINVITKHLEPYMSFWRVKFPRLLLSISVILFLVVLALTIIVGVILYRLSVLTSLSYFRNDYVSSYAIIFTNATAATINLFIVLILNRLYNKLAVKLTELELPRTQSEYDDSLTLKIYVLQFVNYYSSIFYIAFFKGRFHGYPGSYNRIFGYRQEECGPGGCLLELTMQLAIIMVGKQAILSVWEMILPIINTWNMRAKRNKKNCPNNNSEEPRWALDFRLLEWDSQQLFWEYLEMVVQFGFLTIFVASFPLAPLFAILNNVFEMRLDARKLLIYYRRPVSQRVRDIGIWFRILNTVGSLAVVSNACIIAFSSNFIPKMVYKYMVSDSQTLDGFLNYSLSTFYVSDFSDAYTPQVLSNGTSNATLCRYLDYRHSYDMDNAIKYQLTSFFWIVLVCRLFFVLIFQNFVFSIMQLIMWIIPDISSSLKNLIHQENYLVQEMIMEMELCRSRGLDPKDMTSLVLHRIVNETKDIEAEGMLLQPPLTRGLSKRDQHA